LKDYEDLNLLQKIKYYPDSEKQSISSEKRARIADGLVRVTKALQNTASPQIIRHGFERTGLYPLNHERCLSNCDKRTTDRLGNEKIQEILTEIPNIAQHYRKDNGGQVTEEELTSHKIPIIESSDRRKTSKEERALSRQRAVVVNWKASIHRRKSYLLKKSTNQNNQNQQPNNSTSDLQEDSKKERKKRAPNRGKEVIENEKNEKAKRKEEREAKKARTQCESNLYVDFFPNK
jgi:hypothetical protein